MGERGEVKSMETNTCVDALPPRQVLDSYTPHLSVLLEVTSNEIERSPTKT